jgi:hypothetical protein
MRREIVAVQKPGENKGMIEIMSRILEEDFPKE